MRRGGKRRKHWTEILFVERPDLFLPWMKQMRSFAQAQTQGLMRIFEKHTVPKQGRILDLACGLGRISIRLAKAGYNVVGVDISPLYLGMARKYAARENLSDRTRFHRMDSRKAARLLAAKEGSFDAVVSIGTSIGFHGEAEDERVFRGLGQITKQRSILVVETVNRDYLVRHFQNHGASENDGIVWHESRKLDLETSMMQNQWRFYRKIRGSLRLESEIPVSHRVYSLHEFKSLLSTAGWKYLESFGILQELTPLSSDSFHMTVVAKKA